MEFLSQYSGCHWRKNVFLYSCWALTPFALWKRLLPAILVPGCAALREGWHWQSSSYLLLHPNLFFFLCSDRISHLDCWTSTNIFYLLVYAQVNTLQFLPDCMKEGLGQVCWLLLVPQLVGRWVWLLPGVQLGKTPPGSLAYGAGFHKSHRGTFVSAEVPLLVDRSDFQLLKSGEVFIAMIMMSLFWNFTYSKTYFYGVYFCGFLKNWTYWCDIG